MMQAPECALWCIVQAHPALHQAVWQQPHRRQLDNLRHLHGAAVCHQLDQASSPRCMDTLLCTFSQQ